MIWSVFVLIRETRSRYLVGLDLFQKNLEDDDDDDNIILLNTQNMKDFNLEDEVKLAIDIISAISAHLNALQEYFDMKLLPWKDVNA